MPELPEVETIRLQLQQKILGKTIEKIEILSKKNFIGKKEAVYGKKIIAILRSGKYLTFTLSQPSQPLHYLNFHMKMTGQLLFTAKMNHPVFKSTIPFTNSTTMPGKTTRVIIYFTDNSGLFFNDLRKFGWIKVTNTPEQPKGVDVLSKKFTLEKLTQLISTRSRPIKLTLMDQDKLAGIGNIYANDALFLAKIHPLRKSNSLTLTETANLYQAIKKVIEQGIKHGGSSGADEAFINPEGEKGKHQQYFLVYQREGQPCRVCKTPIKRIKHGGRSSFYCPTCQKIS